MIRNTMVAGKVDCLLVLETVLKVELERQWPSIFETAVAQTL